MDKVLVTFSDGSSIKINENDLLFPVNLTVKNSSALGEAFEVTGHHHDGLIPSLTEFFMRNSYFYVSDERGCIYNASTVVSIRMD